MTPIEPYLNEDLLEQATQALRDTPVPDPPEDIVKAVLAAAPARLTFANREKTILNLTKIAAAFIIGVGAITLLIRFNLNNAYVPPANPIDTPIENTIVSVLPSEIKPAHLYNRTKGIIDDRFTSAFNKPAVKQLLDPISRQMPEVFMIAMVRSIIII